MFHGPFKEHSDKFFYINVADDGADTANKIAIQICRRIKPDYPKTGLSLFNHLKVINEYAKKKGFLTVIIDEIEKVKKGLNDILYPLVRGEKLSVIIISNNVGWFDVADIDTRIYRQVRRTILFPSYNAEQIYNILELRVKYGLVEGAMPDNVLRYIAALASQRGGDARYGVELLKYSVDIADSKNKNKVSIEDVEEAIDLYENIYLAEFLSRLSLYEKIIIIAILYTGGVSSIENKKVYEMYKQLFPMYETSYWNYLKIVRNLELIGIIESRWKGKEKGKGANKLIKIKETYLPSIIKMAKELTTDLGLEDLYGKIEKKLKGKMIGSTLDKFLEE